MSQNKQVKIRRQQGQRLCHARRCKRWTITRLAEHAKVDAASLRLHETGEASLTAEELLAAGKALAIPIWFLFEV